MTINVWHAIYSWRRRLQQSCVQNVRRQRLISRLSNIYGCSFKPATSYTSTFNTNSTRVRTTARLDPLSVSWRWILKHFFTIISRFFSSSIQQDKWLGCACVCPTQPTAADSVGAAAMTEPRTARRRTSLKSKWRSIVLKKNPRSDIYPQAWLLDYEIKIQNGVQFISKINCKFFFVILCLKNKILNSFLFR